VAFVLLIAVWALVSGALMLVAAFRLNIDHGRWWLALGGIASIIFGVVLIIAPVVGAVVLTWWLGAYALVFGVLLLVLAFQLHSKREEARRKPATGAKKALSRSRGEFFGAIPLLTPVQCEGQASPEQKRAMTG